MIGRVFFSHQKIPVYLTSPISASESGICGVYVHISLSFLGWCIISLCFTSTSLLPVEGGKRKSNFRPSRIWKVSGIPPTPKMSKSLGLSRGRDLCSFVCDLHLPGPPWTQGQGWVAMRILVLAGWGFGCAGWLSISLRLAHVWPCGLWCDHRRSLTDMVAGDLMSLSCLSSLETWLHPSAPRKGVARRGLSLTLTSGKYRGLVGHYRDFWFLLPMKRAFLWLLCIE